MTLSYILGEYQNCPPQKWPLEGYFEAGNSEFVIHQNCPPYSFYFLCVGMIFNQLCYFKFLLRRNDLSHINSNRLCYFKF